MSEFSRGGVRPSAEEAEEDTKEDVQEAEEARKAEEADAACFMEEEEQEAEEEKEEERPGRRALEEDLEEQGPALKQARVAEEAQPGVESASLECLVAHLSEGEDPQCLEGFANLSERAPSEPTDVIQVYSEVETVVVEDRWGSIIVRMCSFLFS